MKKLALVVVLGLLIISVSLLLFQVSKSRTFQFFGTLVNRVETTQKVVALTFDDAPNQKTLEVLKILEDRDAPATFFVIGKNIEQHPDIARAIVSAGMTVGNHSYSHQRFVFKSQDFIDFEIQKTNQLVRNSGYQGEITFRPPNGKKLFGLPRYLHGHNIKTIMWDIEPDTYVAGNSEAITKYTLDHVRPGSIILLHPFCEQECAADREALPQIINGLKEKGYTLVTIDKLLANSANN